VIKGNAVHGVVVVQVILVGVVVSVPRDNVKWGMILGKLKQLAQKLGHNFVFNVAIFVSGNWRQEVSWVGKTVGTNGAKLWELKVPIVDLTHVAS
jgi:hypothetical protein